ncbi:MAG: pilus assembly protein N-terminal domain-containing protein [candidate division Zixibacteria bacterium]|nr:pilus assembly protein N-terminal domain-containing protein [candidate division Zixibacteria bacterium]
MLTLGLIVTLTISLAPSSSAQEQEVRVAVGKSTVLRHVERMETVSLANEEIADFVLVTPTELVLIGKEVGITTLFIWGESGAYHEFNLVVERAVVGRQIIIEVQVAEVNRSGLSEQGVDFLVIDQDNDAIASGTQTVGSYAGQVSPVDPFSNDILAQEGATAVLKWIGDKQHVAGVIRALKKKGVLKLLAHPRLLSLSGEKASFLVGGEIPIPVSQSVSGAGVNVSVEWKEYGVKLNFVPTIIDSNLIRLKIAPEVSSLDWANSVTFAGFDIPALRSRKADAVIELNSGQSVVLGGLVSSETIETISKVPILGDIPIINFFFRRKERTSSETELLIIVSPRIIDDIASEVIPPLPGVVYDSTKFEEKLTPVGVEQGRPDDTSKEPDQQIREN